SLGGTELNWNLEINDPSLKAKNLDVGSEISSYNGSIRGFWFEAPTDFTIRKLRVPGAYYQQQSIQVVVVDSVETDTIVFDYQTKFYSNSYYDSVWVPCEINVSKGQYVGILGAKGDSIPTNSYGKSGYVSTLDSHAIVLNRLEGYEDITYGATSGGLRFVNQGAYGRTEMKYSVGDYVQWITIDKDKGSVSPGAYEKVGVKFNTHELELSTYNTSLVFTGNDPYNSYQEVPVRLNVKTCTVDTSIYQTICNGDSVVIGDSVFTTQGQHTVTLTNQNGCDSLVHLFLLVLPSSNSTTYASICEGESYMFGDSIYTESGTYTNYFTNQFGCDSVVSLELTVYPTYDIDLGDTTLCKGSYVIVNDRMLSKPGYHIMYLKTQHGCDSIITIHLIEQDPPYVWLGNDTTISDKDLLVLRAEEGMYSYYWNTGDDGCCLAVGECFGFDIGANEIIVEVTDSNYCTNSDTIVVTIAKGLGLDGQFETSLVKIYPNPTRGIVTVSATEPGLHRIVLINAAGETVLMRDFDTDTDVFDISHMNDGIYTIQIIRNDKVYNHQLILMR
ncbi:MAG: T9SS type A sorting domain-containing protein, partial [Bacteroidales bacterium]|nr:T9SS type A sorting domain-containing protein [Bacteroidales bacterium]